MSMHKCNCGCGSDKDKIADSEESRHECGCKSGENAGRNIDAGLVILTDATLEPEEGHKACSCGGKC